MKVQFILFNLLLFVGSFSHAQTSPEILRSDVHDGNVEAVQETIDRGAIVDSMTRQLLWEAILIFELDMADLLLDALFSNGIDVLNCRPRIRETAHPILQIFNNFSLPDAIEWMQRNVDLTTQTRLHLTRIRESIVNQSYSDLTTC